MPIRRHVIFIRPFLPLRHDVPSAVVFDHETWCRFSKILKNLVASYADAEVIGPLSLRWLYADHLLGTWSHHYSSTNKLKLRFRRLEILLV